MIYAQTEICIWKSDTKNYQAFWNKSESLTRNQKKKTEQSDN